MYRTRSMRNGRLPIDLERVYPSGVRPAMPWAAGRAGEDYGISDEPDWRTVDWRPHLRRAKIAGRGVNYVDYGPVEGSAGAADGSAGSAADGGGHGPADGSAQGPPVLFVHGLGGNWQSWLENLAVVGRRHRAIALDLPGFGLSEMPADRVSVSGYGRLVEELCESLELGSIALVGNSLGGFVGAEMAISYPRRVERLTLAASAGISVTTLYRRPTVAAAQVSKLAGVFGVAKRREVIVRPRLRHLAMSSVVRHPTRIGPDIAYELNRGLDSPGFAPALDALLVYDIRERIPEIGCPTLLVWGAEDMLVPVRDADEFQRLIPDSRKVIFEETGHAPMLERPESFNRHLLEFLGETGSAAPAGRAVAKAT